MWGSTFYLWDYEIHIDVSNSDLYRSQEASTLLKGNSQWMCNDKNKWSFNISERARHSATWKVESIDCGRRGDRYLLKVTSWRNESPLWLDFRICPKLEIPGTVRAKTLRATQNISVTKFGQRTRSCQPLFWMLKATPWILRKRAWIIFCPVVLIFESPEVKGQGLLGSDRVTILSTKKILSL